MGEEQSSTQKDVERQARPLKEPDFLQSLASLGSVHKVQMKTTPITSGAAILVYIIFSVEIVVGMLSLKTCPIDAMISIYLIVAGVLGIAIKLLIDTKNSYLFNALIALITFYCIWHLVGSYIVFREYLPGYNPDEGSFCIRLTYLLAFWLLLVQYAFLFLFILLFTCYYVMKNGFKM